MANEEQMATPVTAHCLVGGCGWRATRELVVQVLREVEAHRREKHEWVKPGRLHRLEFPQLPPPAVVPVPSSGKRARMSDAALAQRRNQARRTA